MALDSLPIFFVCFRYYFIHFTFHWIKYSLLLLLGLLLIHVLSLDWLWKCILFRCIIILLVALELLILHKWLFNIVLCKNLFKWLHKIILFFWFFFLFRLNINFCFWFNFRLCFLFNFHFRFSFYFRFDFSLCSNLCHGTYFSSCLCLQLNCIYRINIAIICNT